MAIYGYARVSISIESIDPQIEALTSAGAEQVFQDVGSASLDRENLTRLMASLGKGDTVLVTHLDRLVRSTHDLHTILAAIDEKGAGFRSLNDAWADTTSPDGRVVLKVVAGLADFEQS